ncbi:hypothetical protein BDV59DRAFT_9586 [Aspergillus ambiguus]|uniref:putative GPI anchored protein n=1 Tax=Aspergillus ambiguus TaxID=176160 RepID=UPI003CCE4C0C
MKLALLSLASLAPLVAAHFELNYPPSRGVNEDKMTEFPCGGFAVSSNRTQISLSDPSFPVSLTMGHDETALEVLLALGNDPGSNFNITLKPTFRVEGLGSFCISSIELDSSVLGTNLTDGMNATVQVQSNGDPSGGLYSCADIQFSASATSSEPSSCKNGTGITAIPFTGASAQRNANESTAEGAAQSGSGSSGGSATTSTAGAVPLQTAAWGVLGAAVAGGLAIL